MMARFDDLVIDPRLRRDELLEWVETRTRDELFEGRYRVMTTSGSSGRKGAVRLRQGRAGPGSGASSCALATWMGMTPSVPRRRLAMVRGRP